MKGKTFTFHGETWVVELVGGVSCLCRDPYGNLFPFTYTELMGALNAA